MAGVLEEHGAQMAHSTEEWPADGRELDHFLNQTGLPLPVLFSIPAAGRTSDSISPALD